MNGITTLTDGIAVIRNGEASFNNVSTDNINTSSLSTNNMVLNDLQSNTIETNTLNGITSTEINYLSGTTSNIQQQLNSKQNNFYTATYFNILTTNSRAVNSANLQTAFNTCSTNKYGLYFDSCGTYNFNSQQHIFTATSNSQPFFMIGTKGGKTTLNFGSGSALGSQKANLEFHCNGSSFMTYCVLSDFTISRSDKTSSIILINGWSFGKIENITTLNGSISLQLYNCITLSIVNCFFRFSLDYGIYAKGNVNLNGFSIINNNINFNNISVSDADKAGLYFSNSASINIMDCDFEQNGTYNDMTCAGLWFENPTDNGQGLTVINTHIEGNKGISSIYINSGSVLSTHTIENNFMNRIGTNNLYATHQIYFLSTNSNSSVIVNNNSFRSYGGYVPNASNTLLDGSGGIFYYSANVVQDSIEWNTSLPNGYSQPLPTDITCNTLTATTINSSTLTSPTINSSTTINSYDINSSHLISAEDIRINNGLTTHSVVCAIITTDGIVANTITCDRLFTSYICPDVKVINGTSAMQFYLNINCSVKQFSGANVDDYYLLPPGVKLIIYSSGNYTSLLNTFDNSASSVYNVFAPTTPNTLQSCKYYYNDVEQAFPYIS